MMEEHSYIFEGLFELESGDKLDGFKLAYATAGSLNAQKNNVIWVCHALTANTRVDDWWAGLYGKDQIFDPEKYFIICANMLGSCYGSTDALSLNPATQQPYYYDFPLLTNRDIIRAFDLLRISLGIEEISLLIGGSTGGQQCLEWAIERPALFKHLIPLATNAIHSPWGIAFNESQRMAIEADDSWGEKRPDAGLKGMRAARSIALLSYRSYETYAQTQAETANDKLADFKATTYQQYQGDKLVKRFHAFAYWSLSKAMDSQHVGRNRGSLSAALGRIEAKTLVIGLSSDVLFPPSEQKLIVRHIPNAAYQEIDSLYGHDGFLIETNQITHLIREFL